MFLVSYLLSMNFALIILTVKGIDKYINNLNVEHLFVGINVM